MSISLAKGQKIDLTKGNAGLNKVVFGLGWDVNKYDGSETFDLDASAFLLGANGKVTGQQDFIFYGQLTHPSGAVTHMGDNRTGEGEGDDETILVDLSKMPQDIERVSFVVTIYEADTKFQNFGMVENSYIRAYNEETNEELFRFDLGEDFSIETGVVAGELYKKNGEWKFNAVGSGFANGLKGMGTNFGLEIE